MPRVCTICTHAERESIDAALIAGETFRNIAQRTGTSITALSRHKADHLPAAMVQAQAAAEVAHADTLLAQVRGQHQRVELLARLAEVILARAVKADDLKLGLEAIRTAATVHREMRGYLDLLGELEGELDRRAQVNVLVANPEWLELRSALLGALQAHPEARRDVIRALGKVDSHAAA